MLIPRAVGWKPGSEGDLQEEASCLCWVRRAPPPGLSTCSSLQREIDLEAHTEEEQHIGCDLFRPSGTLRPRERGTLFKVTQPGRGTTQRRNHVS